MSNPDPNIDLEGFTLVETVQGNYANALATGMKYGRKVWFDLCATIANVMTPNGPGQKCVHVLTVYTPGPMIGGPSLSIFNMVANPLQGMDPEFCKQEMQKSLDALNELYMQQLSLGNGHG